MKRRRNFSGPFAAVLVTLITLTCVYAKEPPENILNLLPQAVGSFLAGPMRVYESKELGVSLGYNDPAGGIAITVYLYDAGVQDVPEGISQVILTAKEKALEEVKEAQALGLYSNVRIITDNEAGFDLADNRSLKALSASFFYELNNPYTGGSEPVYSDMYLVGLKGYICKIRASRPQVAKETDEKIQAAVRELFSILTK